MLMLLIVPAIIIAKFFAYYFIMNAIYPNEERKKSMLYAFLLMPLFFCAYSAHSFILFIAYQPLPFNSFKDVSLLLYSGAVLLSVLLISFFEFLFFALFWKIKTIWPRFMLNILVNLAIVLLFVFYCLPFDYFVLGGMFLAAPAVGLVKFLLSLLRR